MKYELHTGSGETVIDGLYLCLWSLYNQSIGSCQVHDDFKYGNSVCLARNSKFNLKSSNFLYTLWRKKGLKKQ